MSKKMPSSKFSNIRRTRFDQSSPVQPVSKSRGGNLSVTDGGGGVRTKEILVSNIGCFVCFLFLSYKGKVSQLNIYLKYCLRGIFGGVMEENVDVWF